MENEILRGGRFYHVYNRAVQRLPLFLEGDDYEQFIWLYDKYIKPVADTLAWALMGNHFHFLVRIKEHVAYKYSIKDIPQGLNAGTPGKTGGSSRDDGLNEAEREWFNAHKWETVDVEPGALAENGELKVPAANKHFQHLFNAYARYFNKRHDSYGTLFERPFKRREVTSFRYLKKVVVYIHRNPVQHGFCNHPLEYPWSSYNSCLSEKETKLDRDFVMKLFEEHERFKILHDEEIDLETIERWLGIDTSAEDSQAILALLHRIRMEGG